MNVLSIAENGDIQTDYLLARVESGFAWEDRPGGRYAVGGSFGWWARCEHSSHGIVGWTGDKVLAEGLHRASRIEAELDLLQHVLVEHPEWADPQQGFEELLAGKSELGSRRELLDGYRFTFWEKVGGFFRDVGEALKDGFAW